MNEKQKSTASSEPSLQFKDRALASIGGSGALGLSCAKLCRILFVTGTFSRVNDLTDQQLLRDYVERQSEAAFAAIVQRYVDLVYSAAFRIVSDSHLAKDLTQASFVVLAQNARSLTDRPSLAGWLHCTARNLSVKIIRSETRRRAREQEAAVMNELLSAPSNVTWEHIAPHLDEALGELSEPDRDAVLLRYFKNHDLRTVGATLGISDDAAQKRVSRAVERLREFFAKRGVTVGASGLAVVISANAVQAAPVGLAVTISTAAALTGTTLATTATATATKAIAMTTLQKTLVTATIVVLAGTGIYEARQASQLRKQNEVLRHEQVADRSATSLRDDELLRVRAGYDELNRERARLKDTLAAVEAENQKLSSALESERNERKRAEKNIFMLGLQDTARLIALRESQTNMPANVEEALTREAAALKASYDFSRKYPNGEPRDEPDREQYYAEIVRIKKEWELVMAYKELRETLYSNDPALRAHSQLWLMAGALEMTPSQIQQVDEILQRSYRDGLEQGLTFDSPTNRGNEVWDNARQKLSEKTYTQVNAVLTQDQQAAFARIFMGDFMYKTKLTIPFFKR